MPITICRFTGSPFRLDIAQGAGRPKTRSNLFWQVLFAPEAGAARLVVVAGALASEANPSYQLFCWHSCCLMLEYNAILPFQHKFFVVREIRAGF